MTWILLAVGGAVATSLTTIFAKIGVKDVDSDLATAYKTAIVALCCVVLCAISGNLASAPRLSPKNWIFLSLSGVATGCSWLCYYKALKTGDVNKIAPIDKSSFVLTNLLFLIFFWSQTTNGGNLLTILMLVASMALMLGGTVLMIDKKPSTEETSNKWLLYAVLSALFASLVSLFVKLGLDGIPTDFGTLVRTMIVLVFASTIVVAKKEYRSIKNVTKSAWIFLTLSGLVTGVAWLCEYYALNSPSANPVAVNSIGKLSILLTMLFSGVVLKEKFTKKALFGLALLTAGVLLAVIFSL